MRIKMTVTAVFRRMASRNGSGWSYVDDFIGIAVTESDYETLKASALDGYEGHSTVDVVTQVKELEFDVLPEMIL
jgi:hypothetical protein